MELRFAHVADFATADASGKLTVVGVKAYLVRDMVKQLRASGVVPSDLEQDSQ